LTKHAVVNLDSTDDSAYYKIKDSKKCRTERKPVHDPSSTRPKYMSLNSGNLRKHNLRQDRSLSNESLVGSMMKGKTMNLSSVGSTFNLRAVR
jgi:hypothetical protein